VLRAHGISKHYGGVYALREASVHLRAGEAHALMGENGAGKSTLAKILAGAVRRDAGEIEIDGRAVRIDSPLEAQRCGVGIIFQELDLFPNLTVGESMVIANLRFPERRWVRFGRIEAFCRPFLDQVELDVPLDRPVAALPIGQQQLLAIARALSMNARVLLMDEPTSSLVDDAVERLFRLIDSLKRQGVAIVYVSHKMQEIFRVADRVTVLRDGETVGERAIGETSVDEIIRMMVGRELQTAERRERTPGETLLRVRNLRTARLRDVSFELRRGEVLGVAGLVGAGRSELGAALFGLDRVLGGSVEAKGRIGLLPEDRKRQGLMMQMSVMENSTLSVLGRMQTMGFVHTRRERAALDPLVRRLGLKCASVDAPVSSLSGGNQQKSLLARWLLDDPDVLFLDDPARGVDVGAKQDIYRIIDELAGAGKGVLLVSSELPELLRCSDRILVLSEGRAAGVLDLAEATQERIMELAAGVRR
jgi:ABC-type sugar transport system ATPase subunit